MGNHMRLIDADALKEGIAELKRSPWYNNETVPSLHAGIKEAIEVVELLCIDKAPTVDAEPVRHGKWILGKCNHCGGHAPFWSMATTYYESNYCPECGARMDKE